MDCYLSVREGFFGGPCRDRTCDHLIKSQSIATTLLSPTHLTSC